MNKRKYKDAFSRLASTPSLSKSGRGSETGWCRCPLCPDKNKKVFAAGRGLAAHLHAVHTPWKPSKKEFKRRTKEKLADKLHGVAKKNRKEVISGQDEVVVSTWEPTALEIEAWYKRVHDITIHAVPLPVNAIETSNKKNERELKLIATGYNRSGSEYKPYRESLPAFVSAAANGDLDELKRMINDCANNGLESDVANSKDKHIIGLLNTVDRNGSIADHWAAGGGHLECLKYLLELRRDLKIPNDSSVLGKSSSEKSKVRRRDGKTTLHYAARHGRVDAMRIILDEVIDGRNGESDTFVDIVSGDGTTPLHLACYGGHLKAVQFLVEEYGAQVNKANEWGCDSSHWACMSVGEKQSTLGVCNYLKRVCKLDFTRAQHQGHTPLHKAAQKQNDYVIKWLCSVESGHDRKQLLALGKADNGGNCPSDIYRSVGGSSMFADWMKNTHNW